MKLRAQTDVTSLEFVSGLMMRLLPLQVLLAALSIVDDIVSSLFASNVIGPDSMAAIGLYSPIDTLILAVGMLLATGSQLLSGRYVGRGETERTQSVFVLDLVLAGVFGAVVSVLLVLLAGSGITDAMANDQVVCDLFDQYLLGMSIGVVPYVVAVQLTLFLSMENRQAVTSFAGGMYIASIIVFTYCFVVVLPLDAFGLALACSLSSWVFAIVLASVYVFGKSTFKFKLGSLRVRELKPMLELGFPEAVTNGYFALRALILNILIVGAVGSAGLSAYATVLLFMNVFWALPDGMLAVSRMLIGVFVGEEDRQSLVYVMQIMLRRYLPLVIALSAVVCLCAEPLTNLYFHNPDDAVYQMTVWGFRIFPWCMPLTLVTMHFRCYGNAMGNNWYVHVIALIDGLFGVLVFSALLMPVMQLNAVFLSFVLRGLAVLAFVLGYAWYKNGRAPRSVVDAMAMPVGFGVGRDERLDLSVRGIEEVVTVSQQVRAFCAERGIDARRTMLAGLCLEEMAGNVVKHGFSLDGRKHSVDIRVVHKGDELILRIKDDCQQFDPAERSRMVDPADKASNIGIRMVFGIATSVTYQHILGINVLTMRI